ncbi:prepilin peptidase [Vibrio sp. ABG19]|uniref:prepilin peptidase n=1 Tax=Vibrio sp. ABG19 TaxID=2817385 RepID=UPI00249DA141|nr:prepilin peptidase [Vibrio sp. ABG19]WGY46139.1 prepilin peptidase [Vibrio sp. ABG19]
MVMDISLWLLLFIVGINDAKEHRIPNYLLGLIVLLVTLKLTVLKGDVDTFLLHLLSMSMFFSIALLFHFCGWMAPGDVKLLAIVGFIFGFNDLLNLVFCIGVSSVFIGCMYWVLNKIIIFNKEISIDGFFRALLCFSAKPYRSFIVCDLKDNRLVMPFAPVVVCGVALAQYLHFSF